MFGLSLSMIALTIFAVLASGAVIAVLLQRSNTSRRITGLEYVICSTVLIAVLLPGVGWAGEKIAQNEAVDGYQEFWAGNVTHATPEEIPCERDGNCIHTYDCDPYKVLEHYTVSVPYKASERQTDGTYKTVTKYKDEDRTRWVRKYHSCPYATYEYTYSLENSFGESETLASRVFSLDPKPWRRGASVPQSVHRGAPSKWVKAKARIDAGDLPTAYKLNPYTNYLLASQRSILSAYSDEVDTYKRAGLLPYHTANLTTNPIHDDFSADMMVFAGMQSSRYAEWQDSLNQVNAYLGTIQGNMHVFVVPASRVDDPDDYTSALLAYSQSRELGKFGLAKNAIMLVIGVSGDDDGHPVSVVWSRAKTGIDEGNSGMLAALSDRLAGKPFEPRTLLGWPVATQHGKDITFTPSTGIVEQTIMRDYPFLRPCMDCKDKGDHGLGYVYLKASAYISNKAQAGIASALFVFGLIVFGLAAWFRLELIGPAIRRVWRNRRQLINSLRSTNRKDFQ